MFTPITSSIASTPLLDATLSSIARLEASGLKPPRLTDPDHARWARLRRALGWRDYIELLHEDAAGGFPEPFDLARWVTLPLPLSETDAELLIRRNGRASIREPDDYLRERAEALGLTSAGALSDLPVVQPREAVLELPGSGGRLMARLAISQGNLDIERQFTLVAADPAERILIGLSIVETRANPPTIWAAAELEERLAKARFDRVLGLRKLAERYAELDKVRLV